MNAQKPLGSAWIFLPLSQIIGDQPELLQGRFEIFNDFLSDHARLREIFGGFEAFVFEPEEVEDRLVAANKFVISEWLWGGLVRLSAILRKSKVSCST
jgi:hypothetical protein